MDKIIEQILVFIFPKTIKNYRQKHLDEYIVDSRKLKEEDRRIMLESKYPINDLFISIGNEWNSMGIVRIIGYNGNIPIGYDLILKKEVLLCCSLIPYSASMVKTLKKLTPYERYGIANKRSKILDRKDKIENEDMLFQNELSADKLIELASNNII